MGLPCHICGQPIDYSLTTYVDPTDGREKRHPMSFELDELVPVSKGGDPLDPGNVAPAHRVCNQMRGNRDMAPRPRPGDAPRRVGDGLPTSREW